MPDQFIFKRFATLMGKKMYILFSVSLLTSDVGWVWVCVCVCVCLSMVLVFLSVSRLFSFACVL